MPQDYVPAADRKLRHDASQLLLCRLAEAQIAFPTFVLQLDVFYSDRILPRIKIRQRLEFGNPAPVNDVPDGRLAFFVQELDAYFLAKIFSADGKSFQQVAALMTGMPQETYAQMMLQGGRSPEGNRTKAEWDKSGPSARPNKETPRG